MKMSIEYYGRKISIDIEDDPNAPRALSNILQILFHIYGKESLLRVIKELAQAENVEEFENMVYELEIMEFLPK